MNRRKGYSEFWKKGRACKMIKGNSNGKVGNMLKITREQEEANTKGRRNCGDTCFALETRDMNKQKQDMFIE